MARNTISMRSLVKTGFGISVGVFLAQMIFIFLGLLFFIPGLILFRKSSSDENKGTASQIGGLVLMALGVVIMGGMGAGFLFDSVGDMFD
jgi:hypothetical protein